jgi:hypothetical protein
MAQRCRCLSANKGEQNKLGETTLLGSLGLLLESNEGEEMKSTVTAGLNVTGHQGGGAGESGAMALKDHGTPLPGSDFLGTELTPNVFTQNLSSGARDRGQACIAKPLKHGLQWNPVLLRNEQELLG